LIQEATALEYINISGSNLDDEEKGRKILEALVESES